MHSLLFQTQCFRLLSTLPIVSLTGLNVNFRFVFPLLLVAKMVLVLYWNCMELLCKCHRIVLVFYCQNKNDQNWYCYFIAKIKMFRIGIGILLLSKSLPCPTLLGCDNIYCNIQPKCLFSLQLLKVVVKLLKHLFPVLS